MKYFFIFFLFSISIFAQTSQNISVVSAEKLNVVYRGVPNPIKIAVPGAKSFTATAPGMKQDSTQVGAYKITPGPGNEVKVQITAVMEDGTVLHEEKVFRVLGLQRPRARIYGNDSGYITITKQELSDAVLDISTRDFLFDVRAKVYDFEIVLPNEGRILVVGNMMSDEAKKEIKKIKDGQLIMLERIRFMQHHELTCFPYTSPIVVEIKKRD